MNKTIILLTISFIINCYSQNDKFNESHGLNIIPLDTLIEKTLEIRYPNCHFIVFPENYSQKVCRSSSTFFMPDSSTISYINQNIGLQYQISSYKFMENFYRNALKEDYGSGGDKTYRRAIKKDYKKLKKNKLKNYQKHESVINQFDKQIIGFINDKGEKLILIQMIDFREDPYNLKPYFKKGWIDGWHGWFETNVRRLHFHLKNNQFTMNEDL